MIVPMATGGKNHKIQCLSTFVSDELTKAKQKLYNIDLKEKEKKLHCRGKKKNKIPES